MSNVKFDSKEFWQEKYEDISRALAAMLRAQGLSHGQFENWRVYLAEGWGADAIEVDESGKRVPRSPTWIDAFEFELKKEATDGK